MKQKKQYNPTNVSGLPEISTFDLRPRMRVTARYASIPLGDTPVTQASADLAGDLFLHNYIYQPDQREQVEESRMLNESLLNMVRDDEEYEESVRARTMGRSLAASFAVTAMHAYLTSDEALAELQKKQQELNEQRQKQQEAQEAQQQAQEQAQQCAAEGNHAGAEQAQQQANTARRQAAAAKGRAERAKRQLQEGIGQHVDNPSDFQKRTLQAVARKAAEEGAEMQEMADGWGLTGDDSVTYGDSPELREFTRWMNNEQVKEIIKVAGRMKGFALAAAQEAREESGTETTDLTFTQDIEAMLPEEAARLGTGDVLAKLAIADWLNHGLLGWSYSTPRKERGPFVGMLDRSSSMGSGKRWPYALGAIMGLALAAREEGRDFILGTFAHDSAPVVTVSSSDSLADLLKWAAQRPSGGTDFDHALTRAMVELDKLTDSNAADIMFFTDGVAHVLDSAILDSLDNRREDGMKLGYVCVGTHYESNLEAHADVSIVFQDTEAGVRDFVQQAAEIGYSD